MPLIEVSGLRYSYPHAAAPALDGVSFTVESGEYLAVVGANGSGKSTLARCLNGLLTPPPRSVSVAGHDPSDSRGRRPARRALSLVFQSPPDQIVASVVEEDVAFGLENLGTSPEDMRPRVRAALERVGLWEHRYSSPRFLSSGQQQRLAVAGALAMAPACLVFDEATAMIDPAGREEILRLMDELVAGGAAILHITHDMSEAARAHRALVLSRGRLVYDGPPAGLFASPDLASLGLGLPEAAVMSRALGLAPFPGEESAALAARVVAAGFKPAPTLRADEASEAEAGPTPEGPSAPPAFALDGASYRYMAGTEDERLALDGVSCELTRGRRLALVGATGSGKSTALQLVAALAQPSAGRAVVLGRDTSDPSVELRSLRMAAPLSIQRPESAIFEPYAGDEVAFGPRNRGLSGAALVDAVRRAMDAVGLAYDEFRDRPSRALSGGQKRRLALASVLAMAPEILVLDEPGSALDPVSRAELMSLLLSAEEGGRSVVFSTHAMEEAARADAVAVMIRGRLAAYGSPEEIFGKGWDDSWGLKRPFAAELAAELSRAYGAQGFDDASLSALRAAVTPAALVAALAAPSAGTSAPSAGTSAQEGGAA